MPTKTGEATKAAGAETGGTKVLAESTTCCPRPGLFHGGLLHHGGFLQHGLFHHGCGGCGEPTGRWYAGGGIYWMQPNFQTNPAFRTSTVGVAVAPVTAATVNRQRDFSYDAEIAPLFWLGYEGANGLGVRGRWFNFEGDSNVAVSNTGADPALIVGTPSPLGVTPIISSTAAVVLGGVTTGGLGTLSAVSDLNLDVWDLEATKRFTPGQWNLLVAAGLRYAHMSQNYRAGGTLTVPVTGEILTEDLRASHNFNGLGPTLALESKRALGDSGLSFYGNARGSVLFGNGRQRANRSNIVTLGGVTLANVLEDNETSQDDVLSVGELEVGAEYGANAGRFRWFVQAGFVGQVWLGAGNASNTAAFGGGVVGAPAASVVSGTESSNMGFVGGVFRLGINF
jgi:hypothetical protein